MKKFMTVSVILLFQCAGTYLFAQNYYEVTPLGGSNLTGAAINNNGQVTGVDDPNYSAFIWDNGDVFYIPETRWGTDINSLGYVTGASRQGSDVYAYIYKNGQMILIPPLSGNTAQGNGINDSSWVAGHTKTNGGTEIHPFLYKDGDMIVLGPSGGGGIGKALNNLGWVVGYYEYPGQDNKVPFIYKGNSLEQLQLIDGSEEGWALDINDAGEACGWNKILATYLEQAVKWDQSGNVISLEQLPNQRWSSAHGINNQGDIVGSIYVQDVGSFAVLWKEDSLTVLNDLIDPGLGINLVGAVSINDLGEILCSQTVGSEIFYYVITPPPSTELIVNETGDESDADLTDCRCDVDLNTDGDQCTLRAAIEQSNADPDENRIVFDISGKTVKSIFPASELPEIGTTVKIDGTSQQGDGMVVLNGINAGASADGLTITGSGCLIKGLVINNFDAYGIKMEGGMNDTVVDCRIGTDHTGMEANPNGLGGVLIKNAANNVIGGSTLADRNVISGNGLDEKQRGWGIIIEDEQATGNIIQGNIIGANIKGTDPIPNKAGVSISTPQNQIGGTISTPGNPPGNIISGNKSFGILISSQEGLANKNKILGNLIGPDSDGTDSLGNQYFGVMIKNADSNQVGGYVSGDKNIISGNRLAGVYIQGEQASSNVLASNYIGLNSNGNAVLGNGVHGVMISNSPNNLVGGKLGSARNVITGNGYVQVTISGEEATGNQVAGNFIGTFSNGATIPDGPPEATGVYVAYGSNNNTIGGSEDNEGNLISGNQVFGIFLEQSENNFVVGNYIGTDITGTIALGNGDKAGIGLFKASGNIIGGIADNKRNVISGNKGGISLVMSLDDLTGNESSGSNSSFNPANKLMPDSRNYYKELCEATLKMSGSRQQINHLNFPPGISEVVFNEPSNTFNQINKIRTEKNKIQGNYIGTTANGMEALGNEWGIFIGPGANKNLIGGDYPGQGNLISANQKGVVLFFEVTGCKVQGNTIGTAADQNMPLPNESAGVALLQVSRNYVGGMKNNAGNLIANNTQRNLVLDGTFQNRIYRNQIMHSNVGISINNADKDEVISNKIWYNNTGIDGDASGLILKGNSIKDNTGASTGVYLNSCSGMIKGNQIEGNSGNGIRCTNGSQPIVRNNNFSGNEGYGLNNTNPSLVVDADENWWGDPGGPGQGNGDLVSSGVDYSGWLSELASVIVATGADTVFLPVGNVDTIGSAFRNWADESDSLAVSITETYDWLTGPPQVSIALSELTGGGIILGIDIPENTPEGQVDIIHVNAISQTNPENKAIDSIVVYPYHSNLSSMSIFPDSASIQTTDTLQYAVIGYDQYGIPLDFDPIWSALKGSIDSDGLYVAPGFPTPDTVWVTDASAEISAYAVITVVDATGIEENGIQSNKDFILYQNYPNPFHSTTKIKFTIKNKSAYKLEVFNVTGKRIATLTNRVLKAGEYQLDFNGRHLPNGIYYYKLQAGKVSSSKKMILLRY